MNSLTEIRWKSNRQDICRCCLEKDGLSDISTYCVDFPDKETYEEILQRTFNIQISSHLTESKSLICDQCISKLQDAYRFKLLVLQSVKTFSEYLKTLPYSEDLDLQNEMRDQMKIEEMGENFENTYQECNDDENELLANLKADHLRIEKASLKRRKYTREKKTKPKRCKIKIRQETVTKEPPQIDWKKITERRGAGPLLRANSIKLIQNSNLCVFQWNKSQYRCFCCNIPFTDVNLLKQHTFKEHTLQNIEKKIAIQQNRLVKVEISNLECKLCCEKLENVSLLKEHLSKNHSISFSDDLLVPFRIEDELKCQICFEKFTFFRKLNIHVNKHFQKQVCHICGAGFSNLVFLNLHKTRSHRSYGCTICDMIFTNKTDKKNHDISMHGAKFERKSRFPCTYCPERFFQENFKIIHMVEMHGIARPNFKCIVCEKSFVTRSFCNNHIKNVHNKERNQECDVCHSFFYTRSDLARHKVTHTGEKKFACEICSNFFASRDSLRRHVKRTHVGVG